MFELKESKKGLFTQGETAKKTVSDKSHRKKRNIVELLKSRVKLDT